MLLSLDDDCGCVIVAAVVVVVLILFLHHDNAILIVKVAVFSPYDTMLVGVSLPQMVSQISARSLRQPGHFPVTPPRELLTMCPCGHFHHPLPVSSPGQRGEKPF